MSDGPLPYPPTPGSRVAQVTPATAAENARLASIGPAAGGWSPGHLVPLLVAIAVGVLGSVGTLITAGGVITGGAIVGAALVGVSSALAGFFGVKSAGPRKTGGES